MKTILGLAIPLFLILAVPSPASAGDVAAEKAIAAVLDDWHAAAAAANEERYFSHFASGAVFLGTDATERWTVRSLPGLGRHFACPPWAVHSQRAVRFVDPRHRPRRSLRHPVIQGRGEGGLCLRCPHHFL